MPFPFLIGTREEWYDRFDLTRIGKGAVHHVKNLSAEEKTT
jgi:hypothetical protein